MDGKTITATDGGRVTVAPYAGGRVRISVLSKNLVVASVLLDPEEAAVFHAELEAVTLHQYQQGQPED